MAVCAEHVGAYLLWGYPSVVYRRRLANEAVLRERQIVISIDGDHSLYVCLQLTSRQISWLFNHWSCIHMCRKVYAHKTGSMATESFRVPPINCGPFGYAVETGRVEL